MQLLGRSQECYSRGIGHNSCPSRSRGWGQRSLELDIEAGMMREREGVSFS